MCKQKTVKIKLFIPAGAAAATPPFGPILGQYGINTVQFCKEFNDLTDGLNLFFSDDINNVTGGFILVVDIFINEDRSYSFVVNKPSTSFLLRTLSDVKLGAPRSVAGVLTARELVRIAKFKFPQLPLCSAANMIKGSARSIGVKIIL